VPEQGRAVPPWTRPLPDRPDTGVPDGLDACPNTPAGDGDERMSDGLDNDGKTADRAEHAGWRPGRRAVVRYRLRKKPRRA
jgi:hypothetical protein